MAEGNGIHLFFGNEEIVDGQRVPLGRVREAPSLQSAVANLPSFSWGAMPGDFHTLLFYLTENSRVSKVLYAAVNIPDERLDLSEQVVPDEAPDEPGTYHVEVLRQAAHIRDASESADLAELRQMVGDMSRVGVLTFSVVPDGAAETEEAEARGRRCRCILHVSAKQNAACLRGLPGAQGKMIEGQRCYNPYPICVKSTGVGGRASCYDYYDLEALPDEELRAFAVMEGIEPIPGSRAALVAKIEEWRQGKASRTPSVLGARK